MHRTQSAQTLGHTNSFPQTAVPLLSGGAAAGDTAAAPTGALWNADSKVSIAASLHLTASELLVSILKNCELW